MTLLETRKMTMRFGGLTAVDSFDLRLERGELVGLIGPNGAGKTTVFNMLTGRLRPTSGSITLQADEPVELVGLKPNRINRLGIARTFQNIQLLPEMSVLENVMMAWHGRLKSPFWAPILGLPSYRREEEAMIDGSLELLDRVDLLELADAEAGSLAYGQQRRLEIVRALATRPVLLLLDEPAAGMNPNETNDLMRIITEIRKDFSLTILVIEHDMKFVMGLCERLIVLDHGVTIAKGLPDEIRKNEQVITAYLGERRRAAD
ncbi:MAG TPA: ABC transporter ATP-binding protein [Desulfobulbaceae bacterium]|nr:ABC transporter ATP-binding protein [Desulfobulbaceae bacterium]